MGSLVATRGLFVEADIVASLEKSIAFICGRFGFASKEEFKWSRRSTSWMRTNLLLGARKEFLLHVVQTCKDLEATAGVVISDETSRTPHSSTRIFLHQCLEAIQNGMAYVTAWCIAMNALSTDSNFVRILQEAELVVSSVTSWI